MKTLSLKGFALLGLLLFLGVAVAPSINADVSNESELVEITTEICGLKGGKKTVQLTKSELKEVDILFDSIRERLNATDSREEAEAIFNEAVVELDKYGLLGRLSVEQAQMLVNGGIKNPWVTKLLEKLYDSHQRTIEQDENFLCLIVGETSREGPATIIISLPFRITQLCAICLWSLGLEKIGSIIYTVLLYLSSFVLLGMIPRFPLSISSIITFGLKFWPGNWGDYPSIGWVTTIGFNGIKKWNGSFYGNLPLPKPITTWGHYYTICYLCAPGAYGFTGLLFDYDEEYRYPTKYLGTAFWIKIGPNPPWGSEPEI